MNEDESEQEFFRRHYSTLPSGKSSIMLQAQRLRTTEPCIIPSKKQRTDSDDSTKSHHIICLDDLPEHQNTRAHRINKSGDHLYRMVKSEKEKELILKSLRENGEFLMQPISSRKTNFQILNGQLSDASAPIRLLDRPSNPQMINVAKLQSERAQNNATTSLPMKPDPNQQRILIGQIKQRSANAILNPLDKRTSTTNEYTIIEKYSRSSDDNQFRRATARSKSVSSNNINRQHMQQRPQFIINSKKLHSNKQHHRKPIALSVDNHNREWNAMTEVMMSTTRANEFIDDLDEHMDWNKSKTAAQLKNSGSTAPLIFERNEYGLLEISPLAMSKLKYAKTKNDYNNLKSLPMVCGHSEPASCFDAAAQRIMCGNMHAVCMVNEKKPRHFYSTEIKELVGSLIHNQKNTCVSITANDIIQELHESKMYERINNSNDFDWTRFIYDYYNKRSENKGNPITLANADLFVNSFPTTHNPFEIGQKLEAIDPLNSSLFCVVTITEKCGYRIKLHFDGYLDVHDFWVNADSVDIFPAGFCNKTGRKLEHPNRRAANRLTEPFDWDDYLKQTNASVTHRACFNHLNTAVCMTPNI